MYASNNEIIYFDSFGVEHVPKEIKKIIGHKIIKANIFRIQANNSIMCGYFWNGFIDFMLADETLIDYTTLLLPCDFKNNDNNAILLKQLIYIKIYVTKQKFD